MSNIILDHNSSISGRYRILVHNSKTGKLRADTGWFNNLITNQGLNRLATPEFAGYYCRVGSSSVAPAYTDVGLVAPFGGYVSGTLDAQGIVSVSPTVSYGWGRASYKFSAGSLSGTIREIGVGWGGSNTELFSRSLLKVNGTPSELVVTSTDLVTVYYELRNYFNPSIQTMGQTVINGVTYGVTARAVSISNTGYWCPNPSSGFSSGLSIYYVTEARYNAWDKVQTSYPDVEGFSSTTVSNYVPNSKERIGSGVVANGSSTVLVKGIRAYYGSSTAVPLGNWYIDFNPSISKLSNQKLTLVCKLTWGRYESP
jgi:hypothetical protein